MTYDDPQPRRLHLSISTRLTLWYGLTLLVLLSLYALFSYTSFQRSLERDFDYHLRQESENLLPYIHLEEEAPMFVQLDQMRSVAYQTDGFYGTFVRLLSPTGEELYRSPNYVGHQVLPTVLSDQHLIKSATREWEDKPARTEYYPLKTMGGTFKGWLEVSAVEWTIYRDLTRFGIELGVGIFLIAGLALGGGYWLARHALHPVASLTASANEIQTTNLSARLPTNFGVRDELTELAETLNELIARLEASVKLERRFTANAAHELLTPLTTIRGEVDIALRRTREAESYQRTLNTMLRDTDSLIHTVHHLLQLSHAEELADLPDALINLSGLVADQVVRFRMRAEDKNLTLHALVAPNVWVAAHEIRLGEVLNNLLDNALKYTLVGGVITVALDGNNKQAHLAVSDTGIGFTEADKDRLFDRFYRVHHPVVQSQLGSGLGLSIVQKIVERYDGTITAQSDGKNQGSTFTVCLPRL